MFKKLFIGSVLLIVLTVLFLPFSGCGPTPPNPTPTPTPTVRGSASSVFTPLAPGSRYNISIYNGSYIYSMVTAQPASKPEANSSPSTLYSYELPTGGPGSNIIHQSETAPAEGGVYSQNQTRRDLMLRQAENQALGNRAPQFSRSSGIDPATPSPISVGTTWNNVNIINTSDNWTTISTTCRAVSDHAYFFVDNRNTAALSAYLAGYCTAFDAIYDVNHTHFGSENDTDGNGKVIVVFSQELTGGLLGYFYAIDKYSSSTYTYSNEGDIFYMTADADYQGEVVQGTLAHEFQHMIYFDEHYDRGVTSSYSWLNEALSQAAEYYNNLLDNHLAWIANFLDDNWAGLSLTHWTSSNYGYGAIFIRYLIDQYGDTAIRNMCATNRIGINAVENATGDDFNTIFNNFTRALVMSGTGDSVNPLYNFTTLNLQMVQPNGRGGLVTSLTLYPGDDLSGNLFPYRLLFVAWSGSFGTMGLYGSSDIVGTAFGLSQ